MSRLTRAGDLASGRCFVINDCRRYSGRPVLPRHAPRRVWPPVNDDDRALSRVWHGFRRA